MPDRKKTAAKKREVTRPQLAPLGQPGKMAPPEGVELDQPGAIPGQTGGDAGGDAGDGSSAS